MKSLSVEESKEPALTVSSMEDEARRPYRLGIALSGGGARGFAHAGALKAIEEAGLKPDIIAGVSAGAVAAVLYAAGIPADEIMPRFSKKFSDYCKLSIREGDGLFSLTKMKKFLVANTGPRNTYIYRCDRL